MNDVDTNNSTTASNQPDAVRSPPHGILKLPQSIAAALASDYLVKREIRDLGVTCHSMLVSLRDCWIHESVPLPYATHRLDEPVVREVYSRSSEQNARVAHRRPHLCIGRFRHLTYRLGRSDVTDAKSATEANLRLQHLYDLHRLVDCRKLTLHLADSSSSNDLKEKLPLFLPVVLPPHLRDFHVQEFGHFNVISIREFVLPSSLVKIEFEPHRHQALGCLSRMRWPDEPSSLKVLHGMYLSSPLTEPLILPEGITTISFRYHFFPLTDLTFPMSITDLEVPVWHDENGRYRDLVFPSCLKRLVIIVEMGKDDFDLTKWVHLPASCENIELKLRRELAFGVTDPWDLGSQPSPPIILPHWVQQLRISRQIDSSRWQFPLLQLSHATSLTSLATDSLDQIQWPASSSSSLTALKPMISSEQSLLAILELFPSASLELLDLSWLNALLNKHLRESDIQTLAKLFPKLKLLVVPENYVIELINMGDPAHPMIPPFREAITDIFSQYATTVTDHPSDPSQQQKTMSKDDMRGYIVACGAGELSTSDERLTHIFTTYALPHGWSNYEQLTIDGFCEFYRSACEDRVENVWNDLRIHGHRHSLVRNDFIRSLISISRSLSSSGCMVEGRLGLDYPDFRPYKNEQFECYQFINGVEVSRTTMTRSEFIRRDQQLDEARFDLKPTEIE